MSAYVRRRAEDPLAVRYFDARVTAAALEGRIGDLVAGLFGPDAEWAADDYDRSIVVYSAADSADRRDALRAAGFQRVTIRSPEDGA